VRSLLTGAGWDAIRRIQAIEEYVEV
jgi:hypothetical protein